LKQKILTRLPYLAKSILLQKDTFGYHVLPQKDTFIAFYSYTEGHKDEWRETLQNHIDTVLLKEREFWTRKH